MSGCKVSRSESKDKKKFFIQVKTAGKIEQFSSSDSAEQTHWVDAIKKAKEQPRNIVFSKMPEEFTELERAKRYLSE